MDRLAIIQGQKIVETTLGFSRKKKIKSYDYNQKPKTF